MMAALIGFSNASLAGHSLAEACAVGHELGFRAVEFLAFDGFRHSAGPLAGFYFERMTEAEREELRDLAQGFERVSLHAQFYEVPILSPSPALREVAWEQLVVSLQAAAYLGASTVTTHAALKASYSLDESWDELVAHYRRLGDVAADLGVTVTIETIFPPTIEDFARLVQEVDHPAVGANVDVGHLRHLVPAEVREAGAVAEFYNDLVEQHVRSLGEKVFHYHLHDVQAEDLRDHRGCGRGIIDYGRVKRVAEEIGFDGAMVFELEEPDVVEALRESFEVVRRA